MERLWSIELNVSRHEKFDFVELIIGKRNADSA